jgi:hypothetical protein
MNRHDCNKIAPLIEASLDGELDKSELSALEMALESCEDCRAHASAVTECGDLLRLKVERAVASVDLSDVWSFIETRLDAESAVQLDPLMLQAFADGELSGSELARVADQVSLSDSARGRLSALGEIGDLTRLAIEEAADSIDYDPLWSKLDAAVGAEIEARGEMPLSREAKAVASGRLVDRFLEAIGGYRAILMSAVTAAAVVLLMLPAIGGNQDEQPQQQVEIRVFVNEVRSNPGYSVSVDSSEGSAPVIYIQPTDDEEFQWPEVDPQTNETIIDNPI